MSATQKPQPVSYGQPVQGQPDHGYAGGPPLGGARPGETVPCFVGTGKWSNALFDCGLPGKCDDATCAVATFCPWSLHGATAKMMRTGHRADACNGWDTRECAISAGLYVGGQILGGVLNAIVLADSFGWIGGASMASYTSTLRTNVRNRHGIIGENSCADFYTHCFCTPCAAAQEHYEVKTHLPAPDPYGGAPTIYAKPHHQSMHAPQQPPNAP